MKHPKFQQLLFARILVIVLLAGCAAPTATPVPVIPTSTRVPTPISTQPLLPTAIIDLVQAQKSATLYEQDFESGTTTGFTATNGKWSIVNDAGSNHIYCNEISDDWQSFRFGLDGWTNYAIQMRLELLDLNADQGAEVYARINLETTGYLAHIYGSGVDLIYDSPQKELGGTSFGTEANTWYTIRIEAAGNRIKLYINDQLIADSVDDQRQAGLAGFGIDKNAKACVDDIRVWALTQDGQIAQAPPVDQVVSSAPLSAPTHSPFQDLPFPRLAMWWPNPRTQPLKDIARYDYVDLFDSESEFIDPLRKLNPNIILLDTSESSNACEVIYDPQNPANAQLLQEIPPEWYLTQVGTTLRADVDASQTDLPVQALTVSNGITTYDLFVPGDTVLIAGESVYVKAVDKASRTLTVQRGFIRPASAHPAGTRIAAHVTFYPGNWMLNLSTLSPKGIADPAVGPETWASFNARQDARLLDDPRWDGLLVDRSDPNESWLITGGYARTIDPDQSNTLLNDYTAFDTAWNTGLSLYLQDLRELIGPNKIIQLNGGINNFSGVNGSNFEDYPPDVADNWHSYIIGPSMADTGSYFEWMANARQPNLTMFQTWENDKGEAVAKDIVPNYRKMRFGLTTALLNNGFFNFLNGDQYAPDGLMWFDEYDNAGAGRGYLGQPLGPAAPVDLASFTPTTVVSTGFNSYAYSDLGIWNLQTNTGYAASRVIDTSNPADGPGSLRVNVTETKGIDWMVSLVAHPIIVTEGTNYTLSFRARADHPLPISVWSQQNHDPWTTWINFSSVPLTTEWQQYTLTARSIGSDTQAKLIFALGKTTGKIWLDDVLLQTTKPDVYRRDFEHGIVLVNASADPVTIPLNGTFKKIAGTQDRSVNDGSMVTSVTVPPQDGIILLRP